ncbi:MAG: glycine cleavage system protein GcvH [Planctomycetota bacterium]|nr:glycine cleavage system protein GcvH [Planctomycetota bacterium]
MADRPNDIQYTKTHEWVRIDGDTATVGITDFAVEHLGDLVFVDLPDVGQDVEPEETVAEVESVKAVGEVYASVTGEVTEVNEDLADDQGNLTSDPFGAGWLFKVKVTGDLREGLMDLPAYEEQLASEGDPS